MRENMIDEKKDIIIKTFVKNFIQKDKRERSYSALLNAKKREKFVDRLNHNWDTIFLMKHLVPINEKNNIPENIKKQLSINDKEICYIISNNNNYDDKFFPFGEIFMDIYMEYFASVIINEMANIIFLKTEDAPVRSVKFIGKKI
jgi:hypothetical protein